jgi:thioredoxin-related protein
MSSEREGRRRALIGLCAFALALAWVTAPAQNSPEESLEFSDRPLEEGLEYPPWFKLSLLDLRDDVKEAAAGGKAGIIVYFGQRHCPYCKALLQGNWGKEDIATYTRKHFDVVPINVWGIDDVVDMQGKELCERDLAVREKLVFTPSLLFYDTAGHEALRLRGFYPPYKFRAALEYVADGYYKRESFRDYLTRADPPMVFELDALSEEDFFEAPPYNLDRTHMAAQRPLVVFFEQGNCHACDVLHTGPLNDERIRQLIEQFEAVQLNFWGDTPVITPQGERTTARKWSRALGLFYTPTLLFYDEHGQEVLRVDSVVQFYRLRSVLEYMLEKGYRQQPNFQLWRQSRSVEDLDS